MYALPLVVSYPEALNRRKDHTIMGNANTNDENNNAAVNQNNQDEKLFTQADLDRIIGQRLAKAKENEAPELAERERQLNQRELELEARVAFMAADVPSDLLDIIKINSKEDIEKAVEVLRGYTAKKESDPSKWVRSTASSNVRAGGYDRKDAEIRAAMGIK